MTGRRIPPSLKWLLNKRARLEGELLKIENGSCAMQRTYQAAVNKLNARFEIQERMRQQHLHLAEVRLTELRQQIEAVERTLQLHEIQIDAGAVVPIKTHDSDRLLPLGHVTRLLLDCLKKANGGICPTTELVLYVAVNSGRDLDEGDYQAVRIVVTKRLGFLVRAGVILRHHPVKTQFEGRWSIPRLAHQESSTDDLKDRFAPL
jgi:hypothetical protein